jgi:protein-tyrosine phosphatase
MINVLFVCLGNICRSPMADGVFQHMVSEAGLSNLINVDSAGMGGWHVGEPAHQGTRNVLKQQGIDYTGRARLFTQEDLGKYDYILAMDSSNLSDIGRIAGRDHEAEIRRFLSYANDAGLTNVKDVPDPYYNGRFDDVYELVAIGCRALLDHIRQAHHI